MGKTNSDSYLKRQGVKSRRRRYSGDNRREETHVPISNTLVKLSVADGSTTPLLCESR